MSVASFFRTPWVRWVTVAVVVVLLAVMPMLLPEFANQTIARIGVFAVAVLGLNVLMGYTGQVSLGQIFFVGLGAYVTAYGVTHEWNIIVTFLLSFLIPAAVGLLIALAAARLGGLAIAMVTLALPIVGVPLAKRLGDVTGGSQGLSARFSDAPEWAQAIPLYDDQWQLYIVLIITAIVFLLTRNLVRGRYGRAFAIVKGNEAVASSMGISPYWYKVIAFTVASLIGGVAGFLYMVVIQYTSPETMSFGHSITLLASMVIGGAASIIGSLIGGAYYVLVPQLTNIVDPNSTALLQGAILLIVLFVLPGGIVSLPRVIQRLFSRGRGSTGRPHQTTPIAEPNPAVASEGTTTERQDQA
jgi:branched-chain amino acid transport system permease protein